MRFPDNLLIVRHAESEFNVARTEAEEDGSHAIDLGKANPLADLTDNGILQAKITGRKIAEKYEKLDAAFVSPYLRAVRTYGLIESQLDYKPERFVEERISEMDHGAFTHLTQKGRERYYPEEAARREREGKYYFKPPGGENWQDVESRTRSFFDTLKEEYAGESVMMVTHAAIVTMMKKVVEGLSIDEAIEMDKVNDVKNCSVTHYVCSNNRMVLREFNKVFYNSEDL